MKISGRDTTKTVLLTTFYIGIAIAITARNSPALAQSNLPQFGEFHRLVEDGFEIKATMLDHFILQKGGRVYVCHMIDYRGGGQGGSFKGPGEIGCRRI